jgi:hypothetical protein
VEYATTFFGSFCNKPIVEEREAVTEPKKIINTKKLLVADRKCERRTDKKMPAVTIVAACISDDTGVGPSMASGNQICRPACADLPMAAGTGKKQTREICVLVASIMDI